MATPTKRRADQLARDSACGTAPSSRRCTCQPASRPNRISVTARDWNTIIAGAMSAASTVSASSPAKHAARCRRYARRSAAKRQASRTPSASARSAGPWCREDPGREHRVLLRPGREQRKAFGEIFRPHEGGLQRDQQAEDQKREPHRRRQIGADADRDDAASKSSAGPARAGSPGAEDCPGTSGGRARRNRSAKAAPPHSCPTAAARRRSPSRRGA